MKKFHYFYFLFLILLSGACKKKDDAQPAATAPAPVNTVVDINSSPRVTGKLDGADYSKVEDLSTVADSYTSSKELTTPPDTSTGSYGSSIGNSNFTISYFHVEKGTMHFMGYAPADTAFKSFFKPAAYPFSPASANGITVIYYDGSGNAWTTDQGSADQTGSSFVITNYKYGTSLGDYVVKIKATFNCKLYDTSGHVKIFTDGSYIGNFANL